jgi:bifunctional non-homologous end joining protein LigD
LAVDQVILDGEVDWGDGNVNYHVFDILWLNGRDLMPLPLIERRAILHNIGLRPPLHPVPEITGDKPWERACLEGWEGVIAKRRDSPYEHRRSPHWLKMKCEASQELVVGGFTDPQGERRGLGALLLGYFEGEDFTFAGKVGTGFDTKQLIGLRARLEKIEIARSPFTETY